MNFEEYAAWKFQRPPNPRDEADKAALLQAIIGAVVSERERQNLTQAQLAERTGTKQSSISRFESGNYNPTLAFLQKIADALEMEIVVSLRGIG